MLDIVRVDGIEDPIEAQDGVDDHSRIVYPDALKG